MWTNVFRIGGLSQISWFQFLPFESDLNSLQDKSIKLDQKDAATLLVLSSHLQLQKEGFLSTWTNSFVGPWDPSQGLHNPDEKIKLWLFIPGRHASVVESAQSAVSRLRVVASGLWLSPGDSEEVAAALSQALRNRIERALLELSYMRFGDVFSKYHHSQVEESFRRAQPTFEFIFTATEESLFVHAIISSKHIRALSTGDIEKVLEHSSNNSSHLLPVIISPHGMCGRLTGFCPNDLVKQVYFSSSGKIKNSNAFIGLPYYTSQSSGCQLRGQNCYVKVSLGCFKSGRDKALNPNSNYIRTLPNHSTEAAAIGRGDQKGSLDLLSVHEKTFIYPSEAVLVPVLQTSFARSSLRRFWLQNWMGPSLAGSSFFRHCDGNIDSLEKSWVEFSGIRSQHLYNSSSNSNNSSISSISSSSSESVTTGARDLEADADSSCRQSGLSSNDQMETDCLKLGSKRPRIGITEAYGQAVTVTNTSSQDAYKSNIGSMEVNNSAITGIGNDQIGCNWDWDDDDRGIVMDIQSLLSEFGDFGDFFENDVLPFGEPPGTAESSAIMFAAPDCGDVGSSPVRVMDVSDQMILPVDLPSFNSFNPPPPVSTEECLSKSQEVTSSAVTSGPSNHTPASSTGEFDHLLKAEALMTFAAEYGAIETPASDSSSIFRNPYLPKSRKVQSSSSSPNNYTYGATPPSSPCFDGLDEKTSMPMTLKAHPGGHDSNAVLQLKKYYTQVETRKERLDRRLLTHNDSSATNEASGTSQFANFNSINSFKSADKKMTRGIFGGEHMLLSMKTVLATEVECAMFQASMLRMRHMLLSPTSPASISLSRPTASSILNQLPGDPSTMTDNLSSRFEVKKKESIPVRIAGDIDGGMLDGHLNAPVGVWRTVGIPKVSKPATSPSIEPSTSLAHSSFNEEGMLSYGQRQPLQELLDGIVLLVQQATSFVDLALDADGGDGPYNWLALQENWRRGFCCGPSMVHSGCGGTLASCHSLDIAGVELVDPLSANIQASSVISLLHSDIKSALKSAFGSLDGPLSVTDWCKGRGQSGDVGTSADASSTESNISECRDSSSTVTLSVGEAMSPCQTSIVGSSVLKVSGSIDGGKVDETSQRRLNQEISGSESEQQQCSRLRPTLFVLPSPAILVGYQDDWLKTSANSLQLWEKAPFEPYALAKPINYSVICPDIDPLTSAAADFFQQLGTVYETCKLGTHLPQSLGNQMEIDSGKWSSSGFVLLDCPQSMKIESSNASLLGSISDYFLSLSNGWDLACYLKSLSRALKALKIGQFLSTNQKEGISSPCLVIYVVCPFPEPIAVLKTVIESSIAIGSIILPTDRDRRSILHGQVGKALNSSAAADETSISNIPLVSGFSVPKLVLQIVTVDAIFRVTSPPFNELVILKETAFTVYNKARRISRGSVNDISLLSSLSSRSHSVLTPMTSIPGMWKDCVGSRIPGSSLPREGDIDSSLRAGAWDNSWQTRTGGLSCDPNRNGDFFYPEEVRYMFEPLFILAESGSVEHGVSPTAFGNSTSESSKTVSDESSGGFMQTANSAGIIDPGPGSQLDGSEPDGLSSSNQRTPSLHCCYGWTEDWRWLVCIWTDARGELLDCNIFPFGGISSRQDTKGLQCLFVQVLQQGCQILQTCASSDTGVAKPRDFVITRIGNFYELEYLEWQKAIYAVGGSEMKKWPLQLRRSVPDGMPASTNGTSLQQQEMSLIQERTLPSSPSPLYSPHAKAGFMKGGLSQPATRKQLMNAQTLVDSSKGLLQWVQSISFVSVSVDHSLHLVFQTDSLSPGGTQGGSGMGQSVYLEGFTPVRSLGSISASYMLIPSPSLRFLPPTPLQLPTCLTAESPPLAHLLHSKGSAIPLSTGFVVSKAVPSMRKDFRNYTKEEWPSVISVSLIDYYGGNNINITNDKVMRGISKQAGRTLSSEARDFEIDNHLILESVAAELHALSWMTVSPGYLERRTALPFHCDMVLRLRRLLHFAEIELSRQPDKSHV